MKAERTGQNALTGAEPRGDDAPMALALRLCSSCGESNPEREVFIYLAGFAVLIALVILISIQDIQRLITGG